ncbi:MAG: cupin domain-containing protein [Clostridiaceae bacterium]|nr:cupin domain-containing protein [Eubacteriales bacterium]
MIEQIYKLSTGNEKAIERILLEDAIHYLHMVLPEGEGLPVHDTNATVYMTVVRGRLNIALNDQAPNEYEAGTMIKIPFQTKMHVRNLYPDTLELIVVKAPGPKN